MPTDAAASRLILRSRCSIVQLRRTGAWAARKDAAEALQKLPTDLRGRGYDVHVLSYASVVYLTGLLRFTSIAEKVMREAMAGGIDDRRLYSALLGAYGINGRALHAAALAEKMHTKGWTLSHADRVNLMRASAPGGGAVVNLAGVEQRLMREGVSVSQRETFIRYMPDLATAMAAVRDSGMRVTGRTVRALLTVCRASRDVAGVATVRALAEAHRVELDIDAYAGILWVHATAPSSEGGDLEAAMAVWRDLKSQGWLPTAREYTAILQVHARLARAAVDPAAERGLERTLAPSALHNGAWKLYQAGLRHTDGAVESPRYHLLMAEVALCCGRAHVAVEVVSAMVLRHNLRIPENRQRQLVALCGGGDDATELRAFFEKYTVMQTTDGRAPQQTVRGNFTAEIINDRPRSR